MKYCKRGKIRSFVDSNQCSFSQENFCGALCLQYLKQRNLYNINQYLWENFRGALKNREKCKSLAQRIFPRLQ